MAVLVCKTYYQTKNGSEVGMIQIAILFVLIALAISIVADIREGR